MSFLSRWFNRRRAGSVNVGHLLRNDREWVICYTCPRHNFQDVIHELRPGRADGDYQDFQCHHTLAEGHCCVRVGPGYLETIVRRRERAKRAGHEAMRDFIHNANVLEAIQASPTSLNLTGVSGGLASSPTAGWSSNWIQNGGSGSPPLYLDYGCQLIISTLTGTPANNQAIYFYSAASFSSSNLPANTNGSTVANSASTSATLTFLTIVSNPTGFFPIATIPYQSSGAIPQFSPFNCAQAYNGNLPQYLWWPMINYTGQTMTPTSIQVQGYYNTVI